MTDPYAPIRSQRAGLARLTLAECAGFAASIAVDLRHVRDPRTRALTVAEAHATAGDVFRELQQILESRHA